MNDTIIQTDGLTKRYGRVLAVDGLSLDVPRGRIFGLLGPNGSGKTTLMSMLLGLVRPTAGSFTLFGTPPERGGLDRELHRIGALIETPTFYPYLSGRNNLAYFQGISGRGSSEELDSLLEQVGLDGRGGDKFQTYSLGMKQRLGLAYTLLGDPELLLLDEPTNGMDPGGHGRGAGADSHPGRREPHRHTLQPPAERSRAGLRQCCHPVPGAAHRPGRRGRAVAGAGTAPGAPANYRRPQGLGDSERPGLGGTA